MAKISIELEEVLPNSFLAMNQQRKIIAYSYSRERVLELSAASGVLCPWIAKASTYPGYPLYVGKVSIDGETSSVIIDERQKDGLLGLLKLVPKAK